MGFDLTYVIYDNVEKINKYLQTIDEYGNKIVNCHDVSRDKHYLFKSLPIAIEDGDDNFFTIEENKNTILVSGCSCNKFIGYYYAHMVKITSMYGGDYYELSFNDLLQEISKLHTFLQYHKLLDSCNFFSNDITSIHYFVKNTKKSDTIVAYMKDMLVFYNNLLSKINKYDFNKETLIIEIAYD